MKHCRVCDSEALGEQIVLNEMMFETHAPFAYVPCTACGSLQIVDPPADIASHYGPGYYSFGAGNAGFKASCATG